MDYKPSQQEISHLSMLRRRAIMNLRAQDWENWEIAKVLGIKESTIYLYVSEFYASKEVIHT